jgi:streptomycin 6-kinase
VTVDRARTFAQRRAAAFDAENAYLLHGDAHQWNTLEAGNGFKLIDPDGVIGEREYDLAIPMRESHEELLAGDPLALGQERCRLLARLTGLDPIAIWEWGFVERVATGLLCMLEDRKREWGRPVLEVADAWALAD